MPVNFLIPFFKNSRDSGSPIELIYRFGAANQARIRELVALNLHRSEPGAKAAARPDRI
jgi:hypothetical protein